MLIFDKELGEMVCDHREAYVEHACCSSFQMIVECSCNGRDEIICPNPDCTGLDDNQTVNIYEGINYVPNFA